MGFLKNVKAMKDAMKAGYDGSGPTEEALASLTPEQRAAYDEQMAKVAAAQTQAVEAQASARAMVADSVAKRPLRGPAGEFVYGSEAQGVMLSEEQIASMSSAELMAWQTQQSKDQFKDLLKNPFGGKKAPPPPMAPVGPAPVDRAQQIDVERAARDAARQPYLAEHRPLVVLGIARSLEIRSIGGGDGDSSHTISRVTGVHAFHPADLGTGALDRLKNATPLDVPAGAPPGIHMVALNWRAVAKAVHPMNHRAYTIPSPFPYLPSTAQELIRMYLDIVGVRPEDSYTVGVTEDGVRSIDGQEQKAGGLVSLSTNVGDSLPCADGESRKRLAGGKIVVIAYRDREEYAAGRERWAAYQRDVLQSFLESQTGWNRPVEEPEYASLPGGLRKLIKAAEKVADFVDIDNSSSPLDDLAPHRYCWPPSK